MSILSIFNIIRKERNYQDKKWGGVSKDSKKSIGDWLIDIKKHLRDAEFCHYLQNKNTTLEQIIKIAALACVCLEYNLPVEEYKNWRDNDINYIEGEEEE